MKQYEREALKDAFINTCKHGIIFLILFSSSVFVMASLILVLLK